MWWTGPAAPPTRSRRRFRTRKPPRAANGGALPPDLTLMVKARKDGANYVYSLLTGYANPPADVKLADGKYYNPYYPGGQISMPPPLGSDGLVSYQDGTPPSKEQMARDVVNFLQWTAEPEMEARKSMGIKVLIYLAVTTVFAYLTKRRIWSKVKH